MERKFYHCTGWESGNLMDRAFAAFLLALHESKWTIVEVVPSELAITAKKCIRPEYCATVRFMSGSGGVVHAVPKDIQVRVDDDLQRWYLELDQANSIYRCYADDVLAAEMKKYGYEMHEAGAHSTGAEQGDLSRAPVFTHCPGLEVDYLQARAFASFLLALQDREWTIVDADPVQLSIRAKKCDETQPDLCVVTLFQNDYAGNTHTTVEQAGIPDKKLQVLFNRIEQAYSVFRCYGDDHLAGEISKYGYDLGFGEEAPDAGARE